MNYTLYAHGGSGNHGCEAIVRSTISMLGGNPTLISGNTNEDIKYGISNIANIRTECTDINKLSLSFVSAYFSLKTKKDPLPMEKLRYKNGVASTKANEFALSIGGDNYCYVDVKRYTMLHDLYKQRGAKTVLWGCSVEPKLLENAAIANDIARYDLITAREPYSYEALKAINNRTIKVADPAFTLNTAKVELPKGFLYKNTVGINLSPMVISNETVKGAAFSNYLALCQYILKETDMSIALIPHVVWGDTDDREPLNELFKALNCPERVCVINDCTCEELKGYISACRFFVASRTHASIAAYSSLVPTLVVGYSIKARGIALDLFGTEDGYVLPVQSLSDTSSLAKAFIAIAENEDNEKNKLIAVIPEYKKLALNGAQAIYAI